MAKRELRKAEWESFIDNMTQKCSKVDVTFQEKEEELKEFYSDLEKKLHIGKQIFLRLSALQKTGVLFCVHCHSLIELATDKMDHLLQFKPSEKLKEFIVHVINLNDTDIPEGIKRYKLSVTGEDGEDVHLCLDDIKWLQEHFVISHDSDRLNSFHDLMIGCDIKLPQPVAEPRNQELEARIRRLKAEQADREYRTMTRNVDTVRLHEPEETIAYQSKLNCLGARTITLGPEL